jgi:hypothetical protein
VSKKKKIIWTLVTVFLIFPALLGVLGSFFGNSSNSSITGSNDSKSAKTNCVVIPEGEIENIQSGMISKKYKLSGLGAVNLSSENNDEIRGILPRWESGYVIAANISGGELAKPVVGLWGRQNNAGFLFALNAEARKYSEWGAAANEGSAADQVRLKLLRFGKELGVLTCN